MKKAPVVGRGDRGRAGSRRVKGVKPRGSTGVDIVYRLILRSMIRFPLLGGLLVANASPVADCAMRAADATDLPSALSFTKSL